MKITKGFSYFLLLPVLMMIGIVVLSVQSANSAGYQSREPSMANSTRLQITADVENGKSDNSLTLKFTLKNISSEDVNIRDTNVFRDYAVRITDEDGLVVTPTEEGQQILVGMKFVTHRDSIRLHPQEEIKRQIVLSKIYDLKAGAVYAIRVERRIAAQDGIGMEEIISNTVSVKFGG